MGSEYEQVAPQRPGAVLTDIEEAAARLLYRRGWTERRLAAYYGVGKTTIRRALGDTPRRPAHRPSPPDLDQRIHEERAKGLSWNEITRELGLPSRHATRARYVRSLEKYGASNDT